MTIKNTLLKLIFICLAGIGNPVLAQGGKLIGGRPFEIPSWFKDSFLEIAEDVAEADAQGKHVLLFFHLNGCPYCNKMANENFDREPLRSQIQQNFDAIEINIKGDREIAMTEDFSTTERGLAEHLKVNYTPTVIFLNAENKTVLRLNGYRSPEAVKQALDYVQNQSYLKTSFSDYKRANMIYGGYQFIEDPLIEATGDLSKLNGPVALLLEDNDCNECRQLHDKLLSRDEIRETLKRFQLIRLDAKSSQPLIDFSGQSTTAKALADKLDINYRPGIVLFDEGREIARIDSMLYPFHFHSVLLFVLDKNHQKFPDHLSFANDLESKLLAQGIDVNIGEPEDW
jgi:thioredoxin-related protein